MVALTAHVLDEGSREEIEEGEPLLLLELVAQGIESGREASGAVD